MEVSNTIFLLQAVYNFNLSIKNDATFSHSIKVVSTRFLHYNLFPLVINKYLWEDNLR